MREQTITFFTKAHFCFFFFFQNHAWKLGVQLIHECGLYTSFYGILFYFAILFTKRFIFLIFLFYWKWLLKIDKILISQLWHTGWWNNCKMKEFKEHGIA